MSERLSLFGTDGYRGAYPTSINETIVYDLARAYGAWLRQNDPEPHIVVARDTRRSGRALAAAAVSGSEAAGLSATYLDVAPTPVTFKIAELMGWSAIMLTASHNPEPDNGFKCTLGPDKTTASQENEITAIYRQLPQVPYEPIELASASNLLNKRYIDVLALHLEAEFGKRPLAGKRIVLDCANGAAIHIGPAVFEALGAQVIRTPRGNSLETAINEACGATHLDNLTSYLQSAPDLVHDPDFLMGLAFDGDADRMMAIAANSTSRGVKTCTLDGNRVLCLFGDGQSAVVGTCYTNPGARRALDDAGTEFIECDNGDKAVTTALRSAGLRIGSEFTGHHVDLSWLSSGDGLYAGARLACMAAAEGREAFFEKASAITLDPEVMLNIPLDNADTAAVKIKSWERQLQDTHPSVVVRQSGTQSLLRVWAADPDAAALQRSFDHICDEAGVPRINVGDTA